VEDAESEEQSSAVFALPSATGAAKTLPASRVTRNVDCNMVQIERGRKECAKERTTCEQNQVRQSTRERRNPLKICRTTSIMFSLVGSPIYVCWNETSHPRWGLRRGTWRTAPEVTHGGNIFLPRIVWGETDPYQGLGLGCEWLKRYEARAVPRQA